MDHAQEKVDVKRCETFAFKYISYDIGALLHFSLFRCYIMMKSGCFTKSSGAAAKGFQIS